jgi:uncharacterized membrane protein
MQYDPTFFAHKRAKLQRKIQSNLRKLSDMAYYFVEENNDIKERLKELEAQEAEAKRQDEEIKKKEAGKPQVSETKVEVETKNKEIKK